MPSEIEWFRTAQRWGRITIRENEIGQVKVEPWSDLFTRCRLDGITVSAGGDYATYPTQIPLHRRASGLGNRDLFGEFVRAAKEAGLAIVAEIDPSVASPEVYYSRPDWFFLGSDGQPRSTDDGSGYYTCLNTPYYWEQIPLLFGEIMERYDVDGFWGRNWQGYGILWSEEPCHCAACREKYRLQRSATLPTWIDSSDSNYRQWREWRRECLREVRAHWDDTLKLFKRGITFIGPNMLDSMAADADILVSDPSFAESVVSPGEVGRWMNALTEGEKRAFQVFDISSGGRFVARPPEKIRHWVAECTASRTVPCFHFPSAVIEDKRSLDALSNAYEWSASYASILHSEGWESAATVGVVVSERTARYYPDSQGERFSEHARGAIAVLSEAGIPFDIVPDTHITSSLLKRYRTLVLPNVACLSSDACDILWEFGSDGGGLVATFETSVYDENGLFREDYGMTDRMGVKLMRPAPIGPLGPESYFALAQPHEVMAAFAGAAFLPGGGRYLSIELLMDHKVPLKIVPPGFLDAPESERGNVQRSLAPAMVLGPSGKGRVVYFPTEPDRLYWQTRHPDHARLLLEAVKWAHKEPLPIEVNGPGDKSLYVYRRNGERLVHLVNTIHRAAKSFNSPVSLTGQKLVLRGHEGTANAKLLVSGVKLAGEQEGESLAFSLPPIETHEVMLLG
jgi:hypothetical protein